MQIVWPSAGRALELFRGAKDDPSGDASDLAPLTNPASGVRHKRSAEQPLDDLFSSHHSANNNRFDEMQPVRRTNVQQQQQQSNYPVGIERFPGSYLGGVSSTLATLPVPNMVVPSGYAWQGGGMNSNSINAHLSTAVLPQLYSTGLVEETSRFHPSVNQPTNPSSRRYPSYYDYLNFPPFGSLYDIREPTQVSQPQSQASQMYIPENYSIYSTPLFFFFPFSLTDPKRCFADSQFVAR